MPDEIREEGLEDRLATLGIDLDGILKEVVFMVHESSKGPAAEAAAWQDLGACGREKMQRIREILTLLKENPDMREFILSGRKVLKPEEYAQVVEVVTGVPFDEYLKTIMEATPTPYQESEEEGRGRISLLGQLYGSGPDEERHYPPEPMPLGPGIYGIPVYRPKDSSIRRMHELLQERRRTAREQFVRWIVILLLLIAVVIPSIIMLRMGGVI